MTGSSNLSQRVVTGLSGAVAVVCLVVFTERAGSSLFALILALGMMYEFAGITLSLDDRAEKRWLLLGLVWILAFASFWLPGSESQLVLASFLVLFSYFLFTAGRHGDAGLLQHFHELAVSFFGLIYVGVLPLFLPMIRVAQGPRFGLHWVLIFMLIVWAGDTGAYFAGKSLGKHKLYPLISPKKTVEGSIGGLLSSLATTLAYRAIFFRSMPMGAAILAPLIVGVISQVGDLGESFLKRAYNRKDSGTILPGHGGFLDRFDGLVFGLPVMYSLIKVFTS